MRIVFLGTPQFALPILEVCARSGELAGVVAQPDRPVGRHAELHAPPTKEWALARGVPLFQPEKVKGGRLAQILAEVKPDVAVVAAYGRIVPPDALAVPRHGCINVHASLLPELRGAAPAQWAIARRLARTGVTVMQMDEGLDTGDIRLQRESAIAPGETGESLLGKLAQLGAQAIADALRLLEEGKLPRWPQETSKATLAPMLRREDGRVDWTKSAFELDARRRGFTPWPGAWTTRKGHVLKVHAARPEPDSAHRPPGEVASVGADGILVASGEGTAWRLDELQPEGKKRMLAAAYLAGNPLACGDRLGT